MTTMSISIVYMTWAFLPPERREEGEAPRACLPRWGKSSILWEVVGTCLSGEEEEENFCGVRLAGKSLAK